MAAPHPPAPLLAAVEAGGTKFNAAVGRDPLNPLIRERIETRGPAETLAAVADLLRRAREEHGPIAGLGIAAFGPIELHRDSGSWGRLLSTPKPGWTGADIVGPLAGACDAPVALDTDVNGAALGEWRWGAGQGLESLVYLTIGTGVGGGLLIDGRTRKGLVHPEIGHVPLRHHPDDPYPGHCPYHRDCAEGLLTGPAIAERLGMSLDKVPADHPFRAIFTDYLGQLCATIVLMTSVERIVIGGGVMHAAPVHAAVQARMREWLAGYVDSQSIHRPGFVVPPALGDRAGEAGAFALAQVAAGVAS